MRDCGIVQLWCQFKKSLVCRGTSIKILIFQHKLVQVKPYFKMSKLCILHDCTIFNTESKTIITAEIIVLNILILSSNVVIIWKMNFIIVES
jgi:hypothetical protein